MRHTNNILHNTNNNGGAWEKVREAYASIKADPEVRKAAATWFVAMATGFKGRGPKWRAFQSLEDFSSFLEGRENVKVFAVDTFEFEEGESELYSSYVPRRTVPVGAVVAHLQREDAPEMAVRPSIGLVFEDEKAQRKILWGSVFVPRDMWVQNMVNVLNS